MRKGELIAARWDEFELDADVPVWHLAGKRTKTGQPIDIPLPTIGVAMGEVKHGLPHFTTHDFRRTARTHLAALGVDPHVAERCLNHKLKGVEGIYNRHDYLDERKAALETWGQLLLQFECEGSAKVLPIGSRGESKKVSEHLRGVDPYTRPVAARGLEPQGMSASIDSPSPVHCTLTGIQSG